MMHDFKIQLNWSQTLSWNYKDKLNMSIFGLAKFKMYDFTRHQKKTDFQGSVLVLINDVTTRKVILASQKTIFKK